MSQIRTCLFGLGHMGRNHYRVLQDDPRFDLVAVVDPVVDALPQPANSTRLLRKTADDLDFELAVVAAPTEMHYRLVAELLDNGRHVFVEKPAASTKEQAAELVKLARAKNLCFAVGNIERSNPVVMALRKIVESGILGRVVHLSGLRAGGFPRNVKPGNNVILDLAVHELDVFRMLLGPLEVIHTIGHATQKNKIYDAAEIIVRAESGATGSVHVNWLTPQRLRSIRVTGTEGVCHVDYIQQTCELVGLNIKDRSQNFEGIVWNVDVQGLEKGLVPVVKEEPLKLQLSALHHYLKGESHHLAVGDELIESVALVERAEAFANEAQIIPFPAPGGRSLHP